MAKTPYCLKNFEARIRYDGTGCDFNGLCAKKIRDFTLHISFKRGTIRVLEHGTIMENIRVSLCGACIMFQKGEVSRGLYWVGVLNGNKGVAL
jgi:hypothetical protein